MSLAEQLAGVKLKKSEKPTKDYSDPKLAGYMNEGAISDYQQKVLEVNTERWLSRLQHLTFPTSFCPLSFSEAELFIRCYETCYKDKTPGSVSSQAWRETLSAAERGVATAMIDRLAVAMETHLQEDGHVFVKTSCRSAKDAPVYQQKFKGLYEAELRRMEIEEESQNTDENTQIICLLRAGFQALKMKSADDVIDTFMSSERIYQDLLLATQHKDEYEENFVIRKFVEIDVDMEFRGFVFEGKFTAASQYNYLVHSKRLCAGREKMEGLLKEFFEKEVKPCMKSEGFPQSYVIDFAVCHPESTDPKVWVIEINPFLNTTDGALFSWEKESSILRGESGEFVFRLTERPKPGAKTMLPDSIRQLVK